MKFFTSSDAIYGERDAGERERERENRDGLDWFKVQAANNKDRKINKKMHMCVWECVCREVDWSAWQIENNRIKQSKHKNKSPKTATQM